MLSDDLFKTDWDAIDIHFSSDRRLDDQALVKLSHLRYVKGLTLHQDALAATFYTPGLFRNVSLNKLYVQHLQIQSVNFQKTKALLHTLRRAHVSIVEIIFEDGPNASYGSGMPIGKIVQPSHIIFTNLKQADIPNIKWVLDKMEENLSAIWLQKVHKDVKKLPLLKQIDNLHVCVGFPFDILDPIKLKNLFIHANGLSDVLKFDESHLGPIATKPTSTAYKHSSTNNVIVESAKPHTSYLIKVSGRDVYDLHVSRETYGAHKPMIKNKSVVQHQKIPTNWALLYLSAP
jgi:hypothetical protein